VAYRNEIHRAAIRACDWAGSVPAEQEITRAEPKVQAYFMAHFEQRARRKPMMGPKVLEPT
jgi:hypothetical protein